MASNDSYSDIDAAVGLPDHPKLPQEERMQTALEMLHLRWQENEKKLAAELKAIKPSCKGIVE